MNAQSMAKDSPPLSQPSPDLNPRPMDAYKLSGDFTNYESLCRGEETHVSVLRGLLKWAGMGVCIVPCLSTCFISH